MILNGSMTQGWMPPSLPLTSLGDALIFEDFCVSSCPGAEWLTLIKAVGPKDTLLGSCSPFACYILLWFYAIALPWSYLSTRSSLLVDFSGFWKSLECVHPSLSIAFSHLFHLLQPFPKPSSWGPTVECTNSPGHVWIEHDGPNKAPWCGTPLGGSSYLAIFCCFFEYGCWMFEYVWWIFEYFWIFWQMFLLFIEFMDGCWLWAWFLLSFPPELLV